MTSTAEQEQAAADQPVGQEIMVPNTGEVLPLDGPSDQLAGAVFHMRELESELARVRKIVSTELTRRLDAENLRKAEAIGEAGSWKVEVAAPATEWNEDRIAGVLDELVEENVITPGAMDRVLTTVRKLDKRELNKLVKTLSPDNEARLKACSSRSTNVRSVKVEEGPGQ